MRPLFTIFWARGKNVTHLKQLPYNIDLNQVDILLRMNEANNKIGELKGILNIPQFVLFILDAVIETSKATIDLILRIDYLINMTKEEMKIRLPKIYSSEIVEHLFARRTSSFSKSKTLTNFNLIRLVLDYYCLFLGYTF